MKFGDVKLSYPPGEEGYYVGIFADRELAKMGYDVAGKDVLEVGPKHGHHTRMIANLRPKKITCVDLPSKKNTINNWLSALSGVGSCEIDVQYVDFLRYDTDVKFDLIFFCGVLYHNQEQLRLLKKLAALSQKDAVMIFESSTTRNQNLVDANVIEICWPERFRGVQTIIFHPSKKACKSLLEISGWDVVASSDDHVDLQKIDRIAFVCRKSTKKLITYEESDINHDYESMNVALKT